MVAVGGRRFVWKGGEGRTGGGSRASVLGSGGEGKNQWRVTVVGRGLRMRMEESVEGHGPRLRSQDENGRIGGGSRSSADVLG